MSTERSIVQIMSDVGFKNFLIFVEPIESISVVHLQKAEILKLLKIDIEPIQHI